MLILSVGSTAAYLGLVRPEVSTIPKRVQEYIDKDPATRPAIKMPPFVVSESRLPASPPAATAPFSEALDTPTRIIRRSKQIPGNTSDRAGSRPSRGVSPTSD